jgi:hypothetical protein
MPENLAIRLITPGKRMESVDLRGLILDLCAWQAFRADELATLWQRHKKYLRNKTSRLCYWRVISHFSIRNLLTTNGRHI